MQKHDAIIKEAEQKLDEYLKLQGLKPSTERLELLRAIVKMERAVGYGDLELVAKGNHICRATVYNTLQLLVKANILRPSNQRINSRQRLYELIGTKQNNVQLVCTKCGRNSVVSEAMITSVVNSKRYSNFVPSHYAMVIYGECKHCRQSKRKK